MCTIVGRKNEIAALRRIRNSGRAEFVAVYGRRRVGKTFLVDEVFRDDMVFHHTGLSPYDRKRRVTMKSQLENFTFSLIRHGMDGITPPKSWMEAFFLLEQFLERQNNGSRQVVFIDELPWMDTPRSGFLTALEAFWNGWGNMQHQLCLIVCGSATSWMLDNLINNKGGLYGRLTEEIRLAPFCLKECEEFFDARGISLSRYNVVQAYMALGGIPYYLNLFNPAMSLAQNIDALFFDRRAKLGDEFERLFNSAFDNAEDSMKIVKCLGGRHSGYTRGDLAEMAGLNPNGDFTNLLKALIASDFIVSYTPVMSERKETYYKLCDPFCWFWIHFKESGMARETDYWQHHLKDSAISAWRGIAFEEVCFKHIDQIKRSLQIGAVASVESSYSVKGNGSSDGLQVDLVIDRQDDVVNVCEMKYTKSAFSVTKSYYGTLEKRREHFEKSYPDKSVHLTLITTYPMQRNEYSDVFQSEVTLDGIF